MAICIIKRICIYVYVPVVTALERNEMTNKGKQLNIFELLYTKNKIHILQTYIYKWLFSVYNHS